MFQAPVAALYSAEPMDVIIFTTAFNAVVTMVFMPSQTVVTICLTASHRPCQSPLTIAAKAFIIPCITPNIVEITV